MRRLYFSLRSKHIYKPVIIFLSKVLPRFCISKEWICMVLIKTLIILSLNEMCQKTLISIFIHINSAYTKFFKIWRGERVASYCRWVTTSLLGLKAFPKTHLTCVNQNAKSFLFLVSTSRIGSWIICDRHLKMKKKKNGERILDGI